MNIIKRAQIEKVSLPGRVAQTAAGKNGLSKSDKMTVGFGHFGIECGHAEPHIHAEEMCYIVSAKDSWISYGSSKDNLERKTMLESGMLVHIAQNEWHCFDFKDDGHVDLVFFYAQVDNIRPEEK